MHLNHDIIDVIADIEILCKIKMCEWPILPTSFAYLSSTKNSDIVICDLRSMIINDTADGIPNTALWFAINYRNLSPYAYMFLLSFELLYNADLIKDFSKDVGINILYQAMCKDDVPLGVLEIITKHYPKLYKTILAHAISKNKLTVIKWIYSTGHFEQFVSHRSLTRLQASSAVIEYYREKYGDRLFENDNNALIYERIKPTSQFACV